MNKDILYRFFSDQATSEELERLHRWLDESKENKNLFFKEKEIYDSILFSEEGEEYIEELRTKKNTGRVVLREFLRTVAAVAIILLGTYFYKSVYGQQVEHQLSMNTITVPAGQYVQLTLSDSTKIWLNALTTLQYPSEFSSKERRVILDGEAYLEVSKDNKRPFIVETQEYQTEVLGTHFNIEAYTKHRRRQFEASLLEGSIKLYSKVNPAHQIRLLPHERAFEYDGALHVDTIHDYDLFRWREGLLCFKNKSFAEIMCEFEKCFGVRIVINNKKVINRHYIGKFRQTDGIDHSLRVLQKNIYFKFERDDEKQIIYIN